MPCAKAHPTHPHATMRITVHLASYLRPLAGDQSTVPLTGAFPPAAAPPPPLGPPPPPAPPRALDEPGPPRQHVNLFVGQDNTRFTGGLDTPLTDGAELSI